MVAEPNSTMLTGEGIAPRSHLPAPVTYSPPDRVRMSSPMRRTLFDPLGGEVGSMLPTGDDSFDGSVIGMKAEDAPDIAPV